VKQLISIIEDDVYSNNNYYNKMFPDFDTKYRLEDILKKQKNKWRSETQEYFEKVRHMKEINEDMYLTKMNKFEKEINHKENEIPLRLKEYRDLKEERDREREKNKRKLFIKRKKIFYIYILNYFYI